MRFLYHCRSGRLIIEEDVVPGNHYLYANTLVKVAYISENRYEDRTETAYYLEYPHEGDAGHYKCDATHFLANAIPLIEEAGDFYINKSLDINRVYLLDGSPHLLVTGVDKDKGIIFYRLLEENVYTMPIRAFYNNTRITPVKEKVIFNSN